MGFLDKVKDTAKQVGEKAQHGVEAGKEKLEETKLKKKIEGLKEEIGGLVYDQRTGSGAADAEAEITRIVAEIKSAEEQIAAVADANDDATPEASSEAPAAE
jgi:hypothetical protein